MVVAIYPGTFDPLTLGHEDIIKRGLYIFDLLIIGITINNKKKSLFSLEERIFIAKEALNYYSNIEIISFKGLLKDFMSNNNIKIILRGLRNSLDFNYEFQMANLNNYMNKNIDTVFMTSTNKNQLISSSIVKEIAILGGDISKFVSSSVEKHIFTKINNIDNKKVKYI